MKKTNKILSVILVILMVITTIPITASAATYSGKCGDTATWKFDKSTGTLTISGEGYMYIYGEFDIPWYSYTERINKIVINSGIESISDYAFYDCYLLTDITILGDIKYIGTYAFWNCNSLKSITLPDTVTEIDDYAFQSAGLTSITIPDSVIKIGEEAFSCSWLENVSIGSGLATIDSSAFLGCPSLTSIIVDKDNKYFSNDEYGVLFDKEKTVLIKFPLGSNIENYVIPGGVTTIVYNAFEDCGQVLKSVVIPKSVTKIWDYAFTKNHYASFDYFDVYYLGTSADWRKIDFKTFFPTLLDFATIHYAETECICDYKGTVTAPTCTKQGYTRYICANCGDSYVDDYVDATGHTGNNTCDICGEYLPPTSGDCGYNLMWTFDESTGTLTIFGTGEMYNDEHQYCSMSWDAHIDSIESVIISEGVTTIGKSAFDYHKNIKNVSIADSVTEIGERAFYNCTGLTEVVIGKGVTEIGDFAFEDCSNLKTVTIYNAVEEICRYAFNGCSKLTDVYYFGTEAEWNAITKATLLSKTGLENATIHFLGEETHECSYNAVVTPPTCTEQGYTTYTCGCGDSYVDDYVDAKGHNHTSEITTPATHTTTGVMTYTCTCGDTYTETIDKLAEHNYETVITAPTCTDNGYTTYTCECSDSYVADYVNATGHTEETIPAVAPTCTETGLTEGAKCSVCGETLTEQKELPANGHSHANPVEENYIAPTCTANGSKDVVVYCSVCDEEISRETVTLDATGHADNDGDGYCDADNELLDPSVECDHSCHKDGISGFFWRIINVFNMLFGLNKECTCGVTHY